MSDYTELVQRLREQYMDTKQMLPNVLCHDSADAITALQARVAELERQRNSLQESLERENKMVIKFGKRYERAEADLAALVELGKERDYAMEMVNVQDGQIDALRALLKVARDCIYSLDAREIYDDELARIDAALAKGKA